jgi:ABC-type nickel/cobalt efflux system permease component RcnA
MPFIFFALANITWGIMKGGIIMKIGTALVVIAALAYLIYLSESEKKERLRQEKDMKEFK